MPYVAAFELGCFDHISIEHRKSILFDMTNTLALANLAWLIENPGTPRLYQVVPKYDLKVRPLSIDHWGDLLTVYRTKSGDCKDFVAIRLAEMRKAGNIQAVPYVTHKSLRNPISGQRYEVYHVQLASGGKLEDPSALLGMPQSISVNALERVFL